MIVVDTHVIIWDALQPEKISFNARNAMDKANQSEGILFCRISLWEIAMLMHKGRIQVNTSYQTFIKLVLQSNKYILRNITPEIADFSTQFPPHINKDPADRIIAATALTERATLITSDQNLQAAPEIPTLW